ncbi:hypothetical protein CF327_g7292, partial [Tilletia walkeri]
VAALSWTGSVAVAAPSSGDRVFNNINAAPFATLKKRGEVDDILQTILNKKKGGSEFCSTFLNLPPYAKTTTSTITKTVLATVPSSTFVQTAPTITATGLPVTKYSTQLDVIDVTPTVFQTVASAVPYTSTVTTVTEVVSETTAVTQTITSYLPVNDRRKEGSGIPDWLETYRSASISKACSKIVTPKTQTSYQTVISTSTIKNGVSTVTNTNTATVVVIPTQTSVVTSTSTRTNPELTSTIVSASSSLVPVTATEIVTSLTTVTSTVVVTLPSPTMKGRIRVDIIENSPFSGYFGPISDDRGFTTLVNINDAALYTIPRLSPGSSGPFNLGNPSGSNFPYLGPIFETDDSSGANIGPGLVNNYLHLGNVAKVTANTQSTDESHSWLKGNPQTYESQVWSLNSDTGALSMTWTNADGSSVLNPALLAFQFGGYINFEWTGDEPDEFRRRLAGLGLKGYLVQGLFFESVA